MTIDPTKKLLVAIPSGSGFLPAYVVDSLLKLEKPCLTTFLIQERQAVDVARNYLIEIAIRMDLDYILFVDDDGVLPSDTIVRLMEDDKDIVGAPVLTRHMKESGRHELCAFEKFDFYVGDGKNVKKYKFIEKLDTSKGYLHKVDAIGGACFLVKKEAFTALFAQHNGRPFEFLHEVHTSKEFPGKAVTRDISEDIRFSERAIEAGFEIWLDTRVRPVHLGKPKFIRFEQEGETLPTLVEPLRGSVTLSENLKLK